MLRLIATPVIGIARSNPIDNVASTTLHGQTVTLTAPVFNSGPPRDRLVNIKSAAKSVMSALIGIALQRGVRDSVEQSVLPLLKRDAPADPDSQLARVTIGNLLSMQAGFERTSGKNYGRWVSSPSWIRFGLARLFVADPGTAMLYSTDSTHLL